MAKMSDRFDFDKVLRRLYQLGLKIKIKRNRNLRALFSAGAVNKDDRIQI